MGIKCDPDTLAKIYELSGRTPPKPKAFRQPDPPPGPIPLRVIVGPIPCRLASEANSRGKLRDKIARKTAAKDAVRAALVGISPPPLPVVVVVTRLGGKKLDRHDNLPHSVKAVIDVIAKDWLGVDDADPRVKWVVRQEAAYSPGVLIDVRTA